MNPQRSVDVQPFCRRRTDRDEVRLPIHGEYDIAEARRCAHDIALRMGFRRTDATLIMSCVSELARNIFNYARGGSIVLRPEAAAHWLAVEAADAGPGTREVELALERVYAAGAAAALEPVPCLPRMDEVMVISSGEGTTQVFARKYLR
jgi:serine/threonine-protein kinase RsbT